MKQLLKVTKFTDLDNFQIGRYAGENGNKKALIHFEKKISWIQGEYSENFWKTAPRRGKKGKILDTIT